MHLPESQEDEAYAENEVFTTITANWRGNRVDGLPSVFCATSSRYPDNFLESTLAT